MVFLFLYQRSVTSILHCPRYCIVTRCSLICLYYHVCTINIITQCTVLVHVFKICQEEFENLVPIPGVDPQFLTNDAFTSLPRGAIIGERGIYTRPKIDSGELLKIVVDGQVPTETDEMELSKDLRIQDIEEGAEIDGGVVPLKPPSDMLNGPQLHPLHIFVSYCIVCVCVCVFLMCMCTFVYVHDRTLCVHVI